VVVFDAASGMRLLVLDGPTVTARRTAAVSLVAARRLAPNPAGPLLVVGAGAQGHAHVEAFATALGTREVRIVSRTPASADALAARARQLGMRADVITDANAALADCPLVVTCTPASRVVLDGRCRPDAFIAAVGAFTPRMVELSPSLCRSLAAEGTIVLDTPDAVHEAGDLLQAGLDVARSRPCATSCSDASHDAPGRCCSRVAAGPAGTWPRPAARCRRGRRRPEAQALGSVTPRWPWYLPPRSL
jgi:1-piperideine-2-carboxylate/1-pyrroline-2-carboxylate reductase [NAD(P)H]